MHPLKIAAKFAAFTWYLRTHVDATQADAAWFAETAWSEFLPIVHEGLGRLLLKIAGTSAENVRRPKRTKRPRSVAAAVA